MSGRLDLSGKDLLAFEARLRQKHPDLQNLKFYLDVDYEDVKGDKYREDTDQKGDLIYPGAVIKMGGTCQGQYLPEDWVSETLDAWPTEINVIVVVDTKSGLDGIGYITLTKGLGNTGEKSLEFNTWVTIDIVCVVPSYRKKGVGSALLAAALHLAWKKGFLSCAIHLSGGKNRNPDAFSSYSKFGFLKDSALVGWFKQPMKKTFRRRGRKAIQRTAQVNVLNDDTTSTLMSVQIPKIPPEIIYTEGLSRFASSIVINPTPSPSPQKKIINLEDSPVTTLFPSPPHPVSKTPILPTNEAPAPAQLIRRIDELELEVKGLQQNINDWMDRYKAMRDQLQMAIQEKEETKAKVAGLTRTVNSQLERIEELSQPRSPSQDVEVLKRVIEEKNEEIRALKSSEPPKKKTKKKITTFAPIQSPTSFIDEQTNAIIKQREEADMMRRRDEQLRQTQPSGLMTLISAIDAVPPSPVVRTEVTVTEPIDVDMEEAAIAEGKGEEEDEEPKAVGTEGEIAVKPRKKKTTTSKYFDLTAEDKVAIMSTIMPKIREMEGMRKEDALSSCKKNGCPICGDRESTHMLMLVAQGTGGRKRKGGEGSEEGQFRVRYNTVDGWALCNACYASLYPTTTAGAIKKMPLNEFAVTEKVVTRRRAVNVVLRVG